MRVIALSDVKLPAESNVWFADAEVESLSAGSLHSAAVLKDGSVVTWGSGKAGKLGHGVAANFTNPTR